MAPPVFTCLYCGSERAEQRGPWNIRFHECAKSSMPRAGFEPATYRLGGGRSFQLSYRGPEALSRLLGRGKWAIAGASVVVTVVMWWQPRG
jgi:hypothetical protein